MIRLIISFLIFHFSFIPDALCKKAAFDIHTGDFASASSHVGDLNAIDPEDAFCKLLNILLEMEQTIEKCFSITPPQKERLEEIAAEHTKEACKNAQALLELVYNLSFPEVIEFPVENRYMIEENILQLNEDKKSKIKIYPNPAISDIYIEFEKELFEEGKIVMKLIDITGKQLVSKQANHLWESLDILKLANGIYLLTIERDGIVIDKQKIIKE